MEVLVILTIRPDADMKAVRELLEDEARASWEILKRGILREVKGRSDKPGAVARLEVASTGEAIGHLDALPLVKANLIEYQIIPLKYYATYEALFKD
jgi:hypothetical protein